MSEVGQSAEAVAYSLYRDIMASERLNPTPSPSSGETRPTRAWILETYSQCLEVIKYRRE
jgi:hypothetical protein